jgi:hypothetical protein
MLLRVAGQMLQTTKRATRNLQRGTSNYDKRAYF